MSLFLFFLYLALASLVIWFQTVAPIKFPEFLNNYTFVVYLLSLVTGIFFVESTKIGATLFNDAWTIRLIAFGINTITFATCTYFFVNPEMSLKNILSLCLCIGVICIQCFMD